MYETIFENVQFTSNRELNQEQCETYLNYAQKTYRDEVVTEIHLTFTDHGVEMKTKTAPPGYEHIRRITGYLVGTLDKFNDGKKAEERDRVKHA